VAVAALGSALQHPLSPLVFSSEAELQQPPALSGAEGAATATAPVTLTGSEAGAVQHLPLQPGAQPLSLLSSAAAGVSLVAQHLPLQPGAQPLSLLRGCLGLAAQHAPLQPAAHPALLLSAEQQFLVGAEVEAGSEMVIA
jgi:hypothetical protein